MGACKRLGAETGSLEIFYSFYLSEEAIMLYYYFDYELYLAYGSNLQYTDRHHMPSEIINPPQ